MRIHHSGYCCYFIVVLACGLLHLGEGQNNIACLEVTSSSDFKQFENSCFYVSYMSQENWTEAQKICEIFKGNLATVARKETLNFLQQNWQIEHKYFWIGLYANDSQILRHGTLEQRRQAEWKWLDGTPYNYQNGLGWHHNEPWYRVYFGVLLSTNWAAEHFNQIKFSFICETKLPYNTTQTTTQSTTVTTIQQTDQPEREKDSPPTQTPPVPSTGQSPELPSAIQPYPTPTDPVTVRPQQPDKADPGGSQTRRPVSAPSDPGNACTKATGRPDIKMFGNSCFYVSSSNDLRDRYSAQSVCVSFNGNLATVAQEETLEFLQMNWQIEHKNYWIGLYANDSQILRNGTLEQRRQAEWKWLDGTPYNYQNGLGWLQHEPWYRVYFGVLLSTNWAAEHFNQIKFSFICETKLPYNTTQTTTQSTTVPTIQQTDQPEGEKDSPPTQTPPVPSTGQSPECGEKWQYNGDTLKCYSLQRSDNTLNWDAAKKQCTDANGHRACPSTQMEHNAVVGIIRQAQLIDENVWIGLIHQNGASGQDSRQRQQGWKWVDGSPYNFTAWKDDEPEYGEKHTRMKQGLWLGIGDGYYFHYLCQRDPKDPQEAEDRFTKDKMSLIGPVLAAVLGVILIAFAIAMILTRWHRRPQFDSMMKCLRCKKSKTSEEHYCDINDKDLDQPPPAHVYYNENRKHGNQVPKTSLSQPVSSTCVQEPEIHLAMTGYPVSSGVQQGSPVTPEHENTSLQR